MRPLTDLKAPAGLQFLQYCIYIGILGVDYRCAEFYRDSRLSGRFWDYLGVE